MINSKKSISASLHHLFLTLFTLTVLFSCSNKKLKPADTVAMLQSIGELATVEFSITKVIKANDNHSWYKPGDRKILITCDAVVKAGINLEQITEKDVRRSGKTITIQLPPPKIISVNLPPENIRVAFEKTGLFRDPFTSEERNGLMVQAETQIKNAGAELGILEQSKINTQLLISRILRQAGFETVVLSFDKPVTNKQ
jgi:hypothetical protein